MAHSEWLSSLFALTFFQPCAIHPNARRSECNFFCVSCTPRRGAPYCRLCLEEHDASCPGPVFQIRKYMYQTCANVEDLQQLLDITNIQAYLINSKRAILLHPKATTMNTPSAVIGESLCGGCQRPLRADCTFCSLYCKLGNPRGTHKKVWTPSPPALPAQGGEPPDWHDAGPAARAFQRSSSGGMPLPILHPVPVRSGLPLEKLLPALALRGAQPNPPLLRLASSLGSLGIAQGQGAWHAKGSPSPSDRFGALAAASSVDGREARPGSAPTEHARLLSRASPAAASELLSSLVSARRQRLEDLSQLPAGGQDASGGEYRRIGHSY